ncbi:MAG TPA: CDP-alcohol phosphatidyltransferase family protein [Steroidobacteraceae bacterium]
MTDATATVGATQRASLVSPPLLLTALRAALAPVVALLGLFFPSRPAFALCLIVAFLSDVLDGVLARRLGIATAFLRRLDSIADSVFYGAATFAVWHLQPAAIVDRWQLLLALLALELSRYALDFLKFRRESAYHTWSAKLWGVALFAAFMSLLAFGKDGYIVDTAIYMGIVADLEGLAISLVLARWQNDVPSIYHALKLPTRPAQQREM